MSLTPSAWINKINFMLLSSAYSLGVSQDKSSQTIVLISKSPRENYTKIFSLCQLCLILSFMCLQSLIFAEASQMNLASQPLSKLSSFIQHISKVPPIQTCRHKGGKERFRLTAAPGTGRWPAAAIPAPFLLWVSVCAAWAEAGIDTIHHECKWAAWFDISNKPVSMYRWV